MKIDNLYTRNPLDKVEISDIEEYLHKQGDSLMSLIGIKLLDEVRRLTNELEDERYKYAGSRIMRCAIVSRNAQIDKLQEEIKQLKENKNGG